MLMDVVMDDGEANIVYKLISLYRVWEGIAESIEFICKLKKNV